jgi:hypothetical protein
MRGRQDIRKDMRMKQIVLKKSEVRGFREELADLKLIGWGRTKSLTGGRKLPPHSGFFTRLIKSFENTMLFSGWAYRFFLSP